MEDQKNIDSNDSFEEETDKDVDSSTPYKSVAAETEAEPQDPTDFAHYRPEDKSSHCGTCAIRGGKLHAYDWMEDLPTPPDASDLVEVQFKNTRKGYYRNSAGVQIKKGDIVAVESSPGHDIGEVTLLGRLVYLQMHKNHINPLTYEYRRVYRVARQTDIEKWEEARALEHQTMLEARSIAQDMHLNMKIGDVEYQGDRTKAIFYYIADERVDFRELIKVLADRFRVRIEMRQIGARQEAGRIGGIGSCGRELCCASWLTNFISVSTHSARVQDLSLNPMKLAGQCGKLKCCLNFELAAYLDAVKDFPPTDKPLETAEGLFYFIKYDIFKKLMWYAPKKDSLQNCVAITAEHVAEIQRMNQDGQKPDKIGSLAVTMVQEDDGFAGTVDLDDDISRFDNKGRRGRNNRGGRNNNRNASNASNAQRQRRPDDQKGDRQQQGNRQQQRQQNGQQHQGEQQQRPDRQQQGNRQQQRPQNEQQLQGEQQQRPDRQQQGDHQQRQPNGNRQQHRRQPNDAQQNNGQRHPRNNNNNNNINNNQNKQPDGENKNEE